MDTGTKRIFKQVGTRPPRPDGVDKVKGRALFGADMSAPGQLIARILRSPHAHAEIVSIDTSAALALQGVKAVITGVDLVAQDNASMRDFQENILAVSKVLYDGHAVAATTGYTRFDLKLDGGSLPGPGMSGTALANSKIQVVPFIHLAGGGRLFDHNRNLEDLANYTMTSPDLAIWKDTTVCAPPTGPDSANLVFAADYTQRRDGVLAPGGQLTISYAKSRLATCASTQGGIAQYGITGWVKFLPGNQTSPLNVLDQTPMIVVPSDARSVQVWFETSDVHGCHAYDSNNGANYAFDAAVAPQWIGNGTSLFSRDTTYKCNTPGSAPITGGVSFDTWTRERAAITNTCFEVYQPGTTDHDDPDLWQKLDVEIHVQTAPSTWTTFPGNFESRQGNNARFAFSWRQADPFREYYCTAMPVTPVSGGQYESVQLGYYITVNGAEYRPEPGANFAATFVDYLHVTDASCPH